MEIFFTLWLLCGMISWIILVYDKRSIQVEDILWIPVWLMCGMIFLILTINEKWGNKTIWRKKK